MVKKMKCPTCRKEVFKAYIDGDIKICEGFHDIIKGYGSHYTDKPIPHTCQK